MPRPLTWLLLAAFLAWHALAVAGVWLQVVKSTHAHDYASYHYAAQVALEGGDPYDKAALDRAATREHTRRSVHPFLYPPSFLLAVVPLVWMPLKAAYFLWFGLGEVMLATTVAVLARWWGRGDQTLWLVLVGAVALTTVVPDNLLVGQANLLVLALTLGGLALASSGRPPGEVGGGALLGLAIALKVTPILLVGWWLLRGRWRPALTAGLTLLGALGLTAVVLGPGLLTSFVTGVLPTLSDGSYNGLGLPVGLFGNHGIPALWHGVLPSGGLLLSTSARVASTATAALLGVGLLACWGRPGDDTAEHAQLVGVMLFGLLVPVFTYEHHLIWALPAVVLAVLGVIRGRLRPLWAAPIGLALAAWCAELATLEAVARSMDPVTAAILRESKFGALLVLLAAMATLGRGRWRRPPAPIRAGEKSQHVARKGDQGLDRV